MCIVGKQKNEEKQFRLEKSKPFGNSKGSIRATLKDSEFDDEDNITGNKGDVLCEVETPLATTVCFDVNDKLKKADARTDLP